MRRPAFFLRLLMAEPALLTAAILGLVEGLSEFLPVSSTGHLIVAASLLDCTGDKAKLFEIVIQAGAILVCWEYRRKLVAVAAGLFSDRAAQRFAINLAVDARPRLQPRDQGPSLLTGSGRVGIHRRRLGDSLGRAAATSRSGDGEDRKRRSNALERCPQDRPRAGIGLHSRHVALGRDHHRRHLFGLSRPAATEFSFFLAIPTLLAATGYELVRNCDLLAAGDLAVIGVGFVVAFISALLVVRWLLRYVAHHDFVPFAWYRIAFGLVIIGTAHAGLVHWD